MFAFYVLLHLFASIGARMRVGEEAFDHAARDTLTHFPLTSWFGWLFLLPYLAIGSLCASLAASHRRRAYALLAACCVVLAWIQITGYAESQYYMQRRAWTAAALAAGFAQFWTIPVMLLALVMRFVLGRGAREAA